MTSTNDVVADAARAGAAEGLAVVAEVQTGGRGRLGRQWVSPPGAGLTFSMLFRPQRPMGEWAWLPLLVGLAVAEAADLRLKWPNDLLVDGRKVGGVLAEVAGDAVVVGVGLNVSTARADLPREDATSLALEGRPADREALLAAILDAIGARYAGWLDGDPVADGYRARCDTIGRRVRVSLPAGPVLEGEAVTVDDAGRLAVRDDAGLVTSVTAGDVVHVR